MIVRHSLQSKRKLPTKSLAWNVFTRLEDDDSRCSCNYYGKTYSCNPATSGTTNLNAHKNKLREIQLNQTETQIESNTKQTELKRTEYNQTETDPNQTNYGLLQLYKF